MAACTSWRPLSLGGVLLSTILVFSCVQARANPQPEQTWTELAQFVPVFAESPSPEAGQKLSSLLRVSPGAFVSGKNAEVLQENIDAFAPYLIEAYRPGVPKTISPRLAGMYLEIAGPEHRARMLAVLHSWFGESPIDPSTERRYDDVAPVTLTDQVAVAEILSEAGDTTAVPAIRRLQARVPESTEAWLHLDQAVMRLEAPLSAGFLAPTDEGGVRLTRGLGSARVFVAKQEVDMPVARQIFHEIRKCGSHGRTSSTRGGTLVRIEFPDGLVAKLTWSEANSFVYKDNARQDESKRSRVGVKGWGLAAVIGGVLRAQGKTEHPLAKMPN